ncbi:MAG TPA: flagellar biosynthetic protein FliR [Gaiellaceae bacterium]|nr:flagellar biosynthetic protein FliR [Gaiellaceae bacterium]
MGLPAATGREVVAFVLVLGRVGPLFVLAPVLSAPFIAARAKFIVAAAFALALTPIAAANQVVPADPLPFLLTLGKEIAVGLSFSLALAVVTAAVTAGASVLDTTVGFSYGAVIDPITGNNNGILGQVYGMFAALVLLVSGGLRYMLMGLSRSYDLVPLGHVPSLNSLARLALDGLVQIPVIGLELVGPVLLATIVAEGAFGLLARTVPRMNVFVVSMPLKILLAFAVIGVSLPLVGLSIEQQFVTNLSHALDAFK